MHLYICVFLLPQHLHCQRFLRIGANLLKISKAKLVDVLVGSLCNKLCKPERCSLDSFAEIVIDRPEMLVEGKEHIFSVGEVGNSHDLAAGMHR